MPKFSLKRRHHRQHDLSALRECCDSLTRAATARMVSDDDIQMSSYQPRMTNTCESLVTCSTTSLCQGMARPAPCERLSDLDTTNRKSFVESRFLCVSPRRNNEPHESFQTAVTNSPWGHFVDMLIPESPSEECIASSEKSQHRFLSFCPEPDQSLQRSHPRHHPYNNSHRSKDRSRLHRLRFSSTNTSKNLEGFAVSVPEGEASAIMLEEAQDALQGLHV
jgi:hypothetical protein